MRRLTRPLLEAMAAAQVAVWQNIAANTYRYARNAVVRAQRLFAEANEIDLKG